MAWERNDASEKNSNDFCRFRFGRWGSRGAVGKSEFDKLKAPAPDRAPAFHQREVHLIKAIGAADKILEASMEVSAGLASRLNASNTDPSEVKKACDNISTSLQDLRNCADEYLAEREKAVLCYSSDIAEYDESVAKKN